MSIQHPTWLASMMLVKKQNGQIRGCITFKDINEARAKNEISLHNIDLLDDATVAH